MCFSILTVLMAFTVMSAGLALVLLANEWYESNYSGHAMCSIVDTIENGDTLQSVIQKFHGFTEVDGNDAFVRSVWGQRKWPIESDDKFYHFQFDGEFGVYFQFRDKKVVNHTDKFFHADMIRQMKNSSKPPTILAYGIRPVRYSILSAALLGIFLCFYIGRQPSKSAKHREPAR